MVFSSFQAVQPRMSKSELPKNSGAQRAAKKRIYRLNDFSAERMALSVSRFIKRNHSDGFNKLQMFCLLEIWLFFFTDKRRVASERGSILV